MGKLMYGNSEFKIDDQLLFVLDAVIAEAASRNVGFQFHITLGGDNDHNLISLSLGHGYPTMIEYLNYPHELDYAVVVAAVEKAQETGMLSLIDLKHG